MLVPYTLCQLIVCALLSRSVTSLVGDSQNEFAQLSKQPGSAQDVEDRDLSSTTAPHLNYLSRRGNPVTWIDYVAGM